MSNARGDKKIRVGMIGCGMIGRVHAERLLEDGRAEIVVCCDPDPASARALRDKFAPAAAVETDERAALERHAMDGVIICSPTLRHYDQASLALELGLHVLCEKPLAGERAQILDLIERQKRLGRIFSISHQRRYKSAYATARRELAERAEWYGPVQQVHIYSCERWQQGIAGTWRDDPAMGAGYFGDAGIHQVDIAYFISGLQAQRVFASSEKRGSRVEIVTAVLAQLNGGANLTAHYVGNANHWREDIHFHCQHADLLLRSEELYRARENKLERITELVAPSSPDAAFVEAIISGQPTVSPPEIALPIYDWTQAVLQSVREARWVDVGPQR